MFNCQESALLQLTHDEAWYGMLKDWNHVRIPGKNPLKEDLSNYIKDQPDSEWEALDRDGVNIHEKDSFVREALDNPQTRLSHPSDVYFYDNSERSRITAADYGTLVLTDVPNTSRYLTRQWKSPRITSDQNCSWTTILEKFHKGKTPPSNSLIIIDRYLFAGGVKTDYRNGIRNVFGILNELLPLTFAGEYHVLLVFDDTQIGQPKQDAQNNKPATVDDIARGLQKIKAKLGRPYVPTIEILTVNRNVDAETFSKTHDRKIISNYYMIRCEHGFSAIQPPIGRMNDIDYIGPGKGVWDEQIFRYESLYAGIDADDDDLELSSLPIRSCEHTLAFLRDYYDKLKEGRKGYAYVCNGNKKVPIECLKNRLIIEQTK